MPVRLRVFFLSMDHNPDVPLTTQRVLNAFHDYGDDMMRNSGTGEFVTNWALFGTPLPTNYLTALNIVAKRGWAFQQHSLSPMEDQFTAGAFETVNKTTPIADLRWAVAHVPRIDLATINQSLEGHRSRCGRSSIRISEWRHPWGARRCAQSSTVGLMSEPDRIRHKFPRWIPGT